MSAYLIYSQDPYLKEIFLEKQIRLHKPQQVLRYSLTKIRFQEIAEKLFNFSLFSHKSIYFLEDCEALKGNDLESLRKVDFRQLNDIYIFSLASSTYWRELPRWEGIPGLDIKELKLPSAQELKGYIEKLVAKRVPPEVMNYIVDTYRKEKNLKIIIDGVKKASLFQPESKEISLEVLKEFLEGKEPGEINALYARIKSRDLSLALSCLQTLIEKGFKEEAIFSILIYKFARDPQLNPEDIKFVLQLEERLKTQKVDVFSLLLELLFYFCQPDVLKLGLGLER